jgi:hypothetical protein
MNKISEYLYTIKKYITDYLYNKTIESRSIEPNNPEPVNPEPNNPEPVNPEPVNPEPVNPEPVNPEPVNPIITNINQLMNLAINDFDKIIKLEFKQTVNLTFEQLQIISHLINLKEIEITLCDNIIPDEWINLVNLKTIKITYTYSNKNKDCEMQQINTKQNSDQVKISNNFSVIYDLINLEELELNNVMIDVNKLNKLVNLNSLSVINCDFSDNKIELDKLSNLTINKCSMNNEIFDNLFDIEKLNLTSLNLQNNIFSKIPNIVTQLNLEVLKIESNPIYELPEYIGKLNKIHTLYVPGTFMKPFPKSIANLTELNKTNIFDMCFDLFYLYEDKILITNFDSYMLKNEFPNNITQMNILNCVNIDNFIKTSNNYDNLPNTIEKIKIHNLKSELLNLPNTVTLNLIFLYKYKEKKLNINT